MTEKPRGRPKKPAHLKRVQIRGAFRVPQWLASWVLKDGNAGKKIEAALISHFELIPPSGDEVEGMTKNELFHKLHKRKVPL